MIDDHESIWLEIHTIFKANAERINPASDPCITSNLQSPSSATLNATLKRMLRATILEEIQTSVRA